MSYALPKCRRCGSARSSSLAEVEPCLFCGAAPEDIETAEAVGDEPGWTRADLGRRRCVVVTKAPDGAEGGGT